MKPTTGLTRRTRRTILWIYGAALLYFVLKQCYFAVFVGGFPDQMAQLSYVAHMARFPSLVPDFTAMFQYRSTGAAGATVLAPTGQLNYLNHPPLYYLLMAFAGRVRVLEGGAVSLNLLWLRFCNIILSSAAVVLAFRLGYTRLRERSPLVHALYAMAVATLPMLAYVGASVNNDNLAFLAMVVFFTGLLRYQEDKVDLKTYLLIGTGFLVGSLSKVTTALIFGIMLAVVLVMSVIRTRSLKLILNRYFLATLPCYLLFLAYELYIKKQYGTWQPSLYNIDPAYFMTTNFYVPPEERVPMTLVQYMRHFIGGMGYTWSSLYGHNAEVNDIMNNRHFGIVFWIPVAAAAFAALLQCVRRKFDRITLPAVIGFLGAMAGHFWSNWKGYPVSGYLGAVQARYYLAMIVPLAFIMCDQIPPLFAKRKAPAVVLAVLLMAGWVAGDALRLAVLYGFPATA